MRERRGPRAERPPTAKPEHEAEVWVDEGAVRDVARKAAGRARTGGRAVDAADGETGIVPRRVDERIEPGKKRQRERHVAPEVLEELADAVAPGSLERYEQRLAAAAEALDRERFADARRMVQPVLRELPEVAFAHEIAGLALYRLGLNQEAFREWVHGLRARTDREYLAAAELARREAVARGEVAAWIAGKRDAPGGLDDADPGRIRGEIARIETGEWPQDDNPLKNAPHTAAAAAADAWTHPYSRETAAFPVPALRRAKYWPPVGRVDNVHGDRNLFCSCVPVAAWAEAGQG